MLLSCQGAIPAEAEGTVDTNASIMIAHYPQSRAKNERMIAGNILTDRTNKMTNEMLNENGGAPQYKFISMTRTEQIVRATLSIEPNLYKIKKHHEITPDAANKTIFSAIIVLKEHQLNINLKIWPSLALVNEHYVHEYNMNDNGRPCHHLKFINKCDC
jgi:hypothetical protein